MGFGEALLRILGAIAALALVLLLAWLVLRLMNRAMPGMPGGTGRAIKVLDRVTYGKNSTLLLLRINTTVILVACSEHAIEKLWETEDPEGTFKPPEAGGSGSFSDAMKSAAGRLGLGSKNREDGP